MAEKFNRAKELTIEELEAFLKAVNAEDSVSSELLEEAAECRDVVDTFYTIMLPLKEQLEKNGLNDETKSLFNKALDGFEGNPNQWNSAWDMMHWWIYEECDAETLKQWGKEQTERYPDELKVWYYPLTYIGYSKYGDEKIEPDWNDVIWRIKEIMKRFTDEAPKLSLERDLAQTYIKLGDTAAAMETYEKMLGMPDFEEVRPDIEMHILMLRDDMFPEIKDTFFNEGIFSTSERFATIKCEKGDFAGATRFYESLKEILKRENARSCSQNPVMLEYIDELIARVQKQEKAVTTARGALVAAGAASPEKPVLVRMGDVPIQLAGR